MKQMRVTSKPWRQREQDLMQGAVVPCKQAPRMLYVALRDAERTS